MGTANGTIIDGGGQSVSTQGHVDGTTINKSGYQDIMQGSLATNTTINGGRQYVEQSTVETTTIKMAVSKEYMKAVRWTRRLKAELSL